MFELFQDAFCGVRAIRQRPGTIESEPIDALRALAEQFGERSFRSGLYRVIGLSQRNDWRSRVASAFPRFRGELACFAYDWLGRVFAVRTDGQGIGSAPVFMFEPGTGEVLEIPCTVQSFHDEELVDFADAALASDFHRMWLESGGEPPEYDQCVGYKVPLFLGGKDEVSNLEVCDVDVYWGILGQLLVGRA